MCAVRDYPAFLAAKLTRCKQGEPAAFPGSGAFRIPNEILLVWDCEARCRGLEMDEFSSGINLMSALALSVTKDCLGERLMGPMFGWEQGKAQL